MISSVVLFLAACGAAYAAQCACKCNDLVFEPTKLPSCNDCNYNHCLQSGIDVCRKINATVTWACNPVDPCERAFEATLCISDRSVGLKCVDMRGILDPWDLDCKCAPLAVTCLSENNCTLPAELKANCDKKCGANECVVKPFVTSDAAAPWGVAAVSLLVASLGAASQLCRA